jgi:hypothetical protein
VSILKDTVGNPHSHGIMHNGSGIMLKILEQLIRMVEGVVGQLGPLGTAATNRPAVPTPGDYDGGELGGMMIGKGNRSTLRKSAPVPIGPSQTPRAVPGSEPGPPRWEASD